MSEYYFINERLVTDDNVVGLGEIDSDAALEPVNLLTLNGAKLSPEPTFINIYLMEQPDAPKATNRHMGTSINPWTHLLSSKFAPLRRLKRLLWVKILIIVALHVPALWVLPAIFSLMWRIWMLNLSRPELIEVPI